MGRRYTLPGENMTLGQGNVLAAFRPTGSNTAGSIIEIERVEASQSGTATSAQIRLALGWRNTSGTLTVTSATPSPLFLNSGQASALTGGTSPITTGICGINSSVDTGGTYTDTIYCSPNNQGGYLWQPIPEHRLVITSGGNIFVARLLATPATTTGWTVTVWFHEVI